MQPTPDKITVPEAAATMGVTPQFLRVCLQQGRFSEFGVAVKMKRWAYYINPKRFRNYMAGRNMDSGGERSDAV